MNFPVHSLAGEHREIEAALDRFAAGLARDRVDADAFRSVHRLCLRHYDHEESFLARLEARDANLAAKLRGQHDEALEIARALEEALISSLIQDRIYLSRRFLAIVGHNLIEEERDVFPLVSGA